MTAIIFLLFNDAITTYIETITRHKQATNKVIDKTDYFDLIM